MLVSRGLPLLGRALVSSAKSPAVHRVAIQVRNSGGTFRYRGIGEAPGSEAQERAADIAYTIFWWWVCFKCIVSYDHLIGEYDWPDASKWTDEELGVPPDDYEPPSRS
ncbi:NADH dehydrogenase [ubiquinone] 1 beta subcomplex subunit 2, mitochondrial-like [Thrips palmi]|uniref:NADH dehydrogenase [ubiquinone] 1 beta subcomplex subunit 2, mitochondrial-like n=1 Tax=Thrips palmi TaxID=161013 RepID=A0A6P8Y7V5_THRPL|nr:NADH dehydrogenase [ubiquinone] 1 beta subcomplex subunit 2, mitochondrial-like [Thrips palmi]